MKNFPSNKLWTVLAGLSALVVVLATGRASAADDYVYQGKSVKEWFNDLSLTNSVKVRLDARAAIKEMGTNALPFLMSEVRVVGGFVDQIQDQHLTNYDDYEKNVEMRVIRATAAFRLLGTNAEPAVPELTSRLSQGKGADVAGQMLMEIDTNAASNAPCVAFTQALTNPVLKTRIIGAACLEGLHGGTNLDMAIPGLLQCLNYESPDTNVLFLHIDAAAALGHIGDRPEEVVPALVQKLSPETSIHVRFATVKALGQFGKSALSAVPALESMTNNDHDVVLQHVVADSIKAIEKDQKK